MRHKFLISFIAASKFSWSFQSLFWLHMWKILKWSCDTFLWRSRRELLAPPHPSWPGRQPRAHLRRLKSDCLMRASELSVVMLASVNYVKKFIIRAHEAGRKFYFVASLGKWNAVTPGICYQPSKAQKSFLGERRWKRRSLNHREIAFLQEGRGNYWVPVERRPGTR